MHGRSYKPQIKWQASLLAEKSPEPGFSNYNELNLARFGLCVIIAKLGAKPL